MRYPLAKQGVFRTVQGEGGMLGVPMTFIRLAGCSIGCPLCDTDYAVHRRATTAEIVAEVAAVTPAWGWVWITGGEPTDHDLRPLIAALGQYQVAVATAGHRLMDTTLRIQWLSVSPHDPAAWVQMWGSEVKIVPDLNGHGIEAFHERMEVTGHTFEHLYIQPCEGKPETVAECVQWVEANPRWRMTVQGHKQWGMM